MSVAKLLCRVRKNVNGNAALEYGLIAGFVSLVIVAGLLIASPAVSLVYSAVGSDMSNACASMGGGSGC
jgi:pilus assembly protein Flp/PilA